MHTQYHRVTAPEGVFEGSAQYDAAGNASIVNEAVSSGASDVAMNIAIDKSALQSLFMLSTVDVTLEINNATTDDEIKLLANKPLVWEKQSDALQYFENPLPVDVTTIYVTNDNPGTAGTLTILTKQDPTP